MKTEEAGRLSSETPSRPADDIFQKTAVYFGGVQNPTPEKIPTNAESPHSLPVAREQHWVGYFQMEATFTSIKKTS
jgi:hypothetical protein